MAKGVWKATYGQSSKEWDSINLEIADEVSGYIRIRAINVILPGFKGHWERAINGGTWNKRKLGYVA